MATGPSTSARVAPATRSEMGAVNALLVRVAQAATRTKNPPNLFATLARHRGLYRRWLLFAGALMPRGKLPRRDTELVILRVAHLSDCEYEADHHRRIGRRAGLTTAQLDAVARDDLDPADWSAREIAILRAVDELHGDRRIGDETFASLRGHLGDRDLVELCMLAGHYEMLAGTINSLGVELDRHTRGR